MNKKKKRKEQVCHPVTSHCRRTKRIVLLVPPPCSAADAARNVLNPYQFCTIINILEKITGLLKYLFFKMESVKNWGYSLEFHDFSNNSSTKNWVFWKTRNFL